jgi:hypothetical protein
MGASEFVFTKDTAVEELGDQLRYYQHWLDTLNDVHEMMNESRCTCGARAAKVITYRLGARPGALLDLDKVFDVPQADVPGNAGLFAHSAPAPSRFGAGSFSFTRNDIDVNQARRMVTAKIAAIPKFSSLL